MCASSRAVCAPISPVLVCVCVRVFASQRIEKQPHGELVDEGQETYGYSVWCFCICAHVCEVCM